MATPSDDWDSHWAAYGDVARTNPAVLYRTQLIMETLHTLGPVSRLVDIGCGEGDLLAALHQEFPATELLGIDSAQEGLDRANHLVTGLKLHRTDLIADAAAPEHLTTWASHGVCSEVLEHVDDPVALLRHASTYLQNGARILVTVPSGPMSAFDHFIGHRQHFTESSLRDVLEGAGLVVDRIERAGFPFFNLYRLLVIANGKRLVSQASPDQAARSSLALRLVSSVFRIAFHANNRQSPWGWQLFAIARIPTTA